MMTIFSSSSRFFLSFILIVVNVVLLLVSGRLQPYADAKDLINLQNFQSNLPIVTVHLPGKVQDLSEGTEVILEIQSNDWNEDGEPVDKFMGTATMKMRGRSTRWHRQKQYSVRLNGGAASLLGLPAHEDWILKGPYVDRSLVRNALTYELSRSMGHYASRTAFCELLLIKGKGKRRRRKERNEDDQGALYQGIYLLVERIHRDENRLNIADLQPDHNHLPELSGGYIIKQEFGEWRQGIDNAFWTDRGTPFILVHPSIGTVTPQQNEYIRNYVNEVESVLFDSSNGSGAGGPGGDDHDHDHEGDLFMDPVRGYRRYLNVSTFIDTFLLQELSKNVDGFRLSTFYYKDRDGLLSSGPEWDFDVAWGNADYNDAWLPEGWHAFTNQPSAPWWRRLFDDPSYGEAMLLRWQSLRAEDGVLSDNSIFAIIDGYVDQLSEAADRHLKKWKLLGRKSRDLMNQPDLDPCPQSFLEEIEYLKDWIKKRGKWMDENLPVMVRSFREQSFNIYYDSFGGIDARQKTRHKWKE